MTNHNPKLCFGVPQYFVPICIEHEHGFYGGPAGYQEMTRELARAQGVIILPVARQPVNCESGKD